MNYQDFLEEQQAQWPLGQLHTWHQAHEIALGSPLSHPLQDSEWLRSAGFVQVSIARPKSHTLPLSEVRAFTQKVFQQAPEDAAFGMEVTDAEPGHNAITVRILIAQAQAQD